MVTPEQDRLREIAKSNSLSAIIGRLLLGGWRRVENLLFWVVIFFVTLYFVLQTPFVQNWLIQKIAGYYASEWKTRVEIKHIDFEFFDNLVLEGVFLADQSGDTLLMAEELVAGLNTGIFDLASGRLEFNDIALRHARVHLSRRENTTKNNLQFILDYFKKPKKPGGKKSTFSMRIQNLNLVDVEFQQLDEVNGNLQKIKIPRGQIRLNEFNLREQLIDIQLVKLSGLTVVAQDFDPKPLPPDMLAQLKKSADSLANVVAQTQATTPKDSANKAQLHLILHKFELENGRLVFDEFQKSKARTTPAGVIDWEHIDLRDIGVAIDGFEMKNGLNIAAAVRHLGATEAWSGFELNHLEADFLTLSNKKISLSGMVIQTPFSEISDSLSMTYDGLSTFKKDLESGVKFDANFAEGTHVALSDIAHFDAAIGKNAFFQKNKSAVAELSGHVYGDLNGLKGRDFLLKMSPALALECNFNTRNLLNPDGTQEFNFKIKNLQTDMATMRQVIPGFAVPKNFDKLGKVAFSGNLDGFSSNFVVEGNLLTDLGGGVLNMNLNMNEGKEAAVYGGKLTLHQFDLGRWTGQKDLGKTAFTVTLQNGRGLTATTLRADLNAHIDTLVYRNYVYRNLNADGVLDKFKFKGRLSSDDPNSKFELLGNVDFEGQPSMDFSANLEKFDLRKLNFSKREIVVSGKIDRVIARGNRLDNLFGEANILNLRVIEAGKGDWSIPAAAIGSRMTDGGERYLYFNSTLGSFSLEGKFNPERVPATLLNLAARHYPEFSQKFGIREKDTLPMSESFRFHLNIANTRDFTRLFDEKLGNLAGIALAGQVNGPRNFIKMNAQIPAFRYDKYGMDEVFLDITTLGQNTALGLTIGRTLLSKKDTLAPISFDARLDRDTVMFSLNAKNLSNVLNNVLLSGKFFAVDSLWQVSFDPSKMTLAGINWDIARDNFLRFGRGQVETKNFQIRDGDRVIALNSKDKKGMILSLNQFALEDLHRFGKFRKLDFGGNFEIWAEVDNIFTQKGMKIWFSSSDSITINKVNYGFFNSYIEMADLKSPLDFNLDLIEQKNGQSLNVRGFYLPPGAKKMADQPTLKPGSFDFKVKGESFPFAILETFVSGISKTGGITDLNGRLWGNPDAVDMSGTARIIDGWTTIDYLGTRYRIDNQVISLSSYAISAHDTVVDAIGILRTRPDTILDVRGKPAVITGSIRHDHFHKWKLDLEIESDDFLVLKTTKAQNPTYYGTGIGKIDVVFGGNFSTTDIQVNATTLAGSQLFIPLTDSEDAAEVTFIKFKPKQTAVVDPKKAEKSFEVEGLKGLNFGMNLTLTPEAEVQLIFDEVAGDIITGHGHGDIGITYDVTSELKMYGDYVIDDGNYLFTYFGSGALSFLQTNKPFSVNPGGTIRWDGDPLAATINLAAAYKGLQTSPYNFIQDELLATSNDEIREAQRTTRVQLTMGLTGALFKPDISFDIQFPDLTGNLKTATDNKLRIARQDPNEINRQAFGLLVIGSFLPDAGGVLSVGATTIDAGVNTLSQMVTSQLSNYLSSLVTSFAEGSFIEKIDFDINYNRSQNIGSNNIAGLNQELALRLSSSLANDLIRIQGGANFGLSGQNNYQGTSGFLGEDVVVEIRLTEDRRWVLKFFQRLSPDFLAGGTRLRAGGGISFRKEYDSLGEMLGGLKRKK